MKRTQSNYDAGNSSTVNDGFRPGVRLSGQVNEKDIYKLTTVFGNAFQAHHEQLRSEKAAAVETDLEEMIRNMGLMDHGGAPVRSNHGERSRAEDYTSMTSRVNDLELLDLCKSPFLSKLTEEQLQQLQGDETFQNLQRCISGQLAKDEKDREVCIPRILLANWNNHGWIGEFKNSIERKDSSSGISFLFLEIIITRMGIYDGASAVFVFRVVEDSKLKGLRPKGNVLPDHTFKPCVFVNCVVVFGKMPLQMQSRNSCLQ